jgi:hypothetical protein
MALSWADELPIISISAPTVPWTVVAAVQEAQDDHH